MEYDIIAVILALFLNTISNLFEGFQAYQSRKNNIDSIDLDYQRRYSELLNQAQDIHIYIEDPHFSFTKLRKKELQKNLTHWAEKYFRLSFEQWRAANVSKSIPKYISKGWDAAIQDAMRKPFFQQMWEKEFSKRSFNGYMEFNEYVERFLKR